MENKVLCGCHNVTLKDVQEQIKQGITEFEALQKITNIGTDCPPCKEQNERLFIILLDEEANNTF